MKTKKVWVLIVWSWGAGQRCALHLREQGYTDLLIVWDRPFDDPHTTQARWWINAALATMDHEDTPLIHAVDTFREGQCVAHPHLVETLTNHAPDAIHDLIRRGANFHHEQDGSLTQRFFWAHTYRRTVFSGDQTGLEMIKTMSNTSREFGIPFLQNTYVYKLLTTDNTVTGVLAVHKNELLHIQAAVVVFATGWFSNVYWRSSSRPGENFWDGIYQAFQAGALIGDIELVQFHPTGLLYPAEKSGELVTEAVRGEGGILLNGKGERFMDKYDPQKMELSTRDVVARANFAEIHAGRWTPNWGVWLDISHRSKEYILERLPKMYQMILEYNNVDISKQPVEVSPTTHYTMGWIHFDPYSLDTAIQNFYVAGECTMWVHGANRLWGNSLMETMVFGKLVAERILSKWIPTFTDNNAVDTSLPIKISEQGKDGTILLESIRKQTWEYAGIVRVAHELEQLQKYLITTEKQLKDTWILSTWSLRQDTILSTRISSVLTLGRLICLWALQRKESRWAHYRIDYPQLSETYNKNYLHQQTTTGEIISTWHDLPLPSTRLQAWLDQQNDLIRLKNYTHQE